MTEATPIIGLTDEPKADPIILPTTYKREGNLKEQKPITAQQWRNEGRPFGWHYDDSNLLKMLEYGYQPEDLTGPENAKRWHELNFQAGLTGLNVEEADNIADFSNCIASEAIALTTEKGLTAKECRRGKLPNGFIDIDPIFKDLKAVGISLADIDQEQATLYNGLLDVSEKHGLNPAECAILAMASNKLNEKIVQAYSSAKPLTAEDVKQGKYPEGAMQAKNIIKTLNTNNLPISTFLNDAEVKTWGELMKLDPKAKGFSARDSYLFTKLSSKLAKEYDAYINQPDTITPEMWAQGVRPVGYESCDRTLGNYKALFPFDDKVIDGLIGEYDTDKYSTLSKNAKVDGLTRAEGEELAKITRKINFKVIDRTPRMFADTLYINRGIEV